MVAPVSFEVHSDRVEEKVTLFWCAYPEIGDANFLRVHYDINWPEYCVCVLLFLSFSYKRLCIVIFGIHVIYTLIFFAFTPAFAW